MRVTGIETARRAVKYEAEERFPPDKFHIEETRWSDGDYEVRAIHGKKQTEGGNLIREEIVCTPFSMKFEVREIHSNLEWTTHSEEILDNDGY